MSRFNLTPDRVYKVEYYKVYTTDGDLTCFTTATISDCNSPLGLSLALLHE